ncbi:MAG: hypothetical protein FWH02_06950 [Oscillospiraceae bacterium]|nr:hypothetical protein [Oscillospiraceae bacterium]
MPERQAKSNHRDTSVFRFRLAEKPGIIEGDIQGNGVAGSPYDEAG